MKDLKQLFMKEYTPTRGNTALLFMVFFTVFLIPLLPAVLHRVVAIYSVETKRGLILWIAVIATATEWLASSLDLRFLILISYSVNILFFAIVVFKMIFEIASTKDVNVRVIIEAIKGRL